MRYLILFAFAFSFSLAHADGGHWPDQDEYQGQNDGYDQYYPDYDDDDGDYRRGGDTVIINNETNIFIDINVYPDAPAIMPLPPTYYNGARCFWEPRPWGWTLFVNTYYGVYPLGHGQYPGQLQHFWWQMYQSGRCGNLY